MVTSTSIPVQSLQPYYQPKKVEDGQQGSWLQPVERASTDIASLSSTLPASGNTVIAAPSARRLASQLRQRQSLHGVNYASRLAEYMADPKYTAFDGDLRMKNGRIILAHDKGAKDTLDLQETIDLLLAQPANKSGTVKLDIKEKEVIQPLISLLQESMAQHPEKWKGKTLVLNADVNLGGRIYPWRNIKLKDMQALRAAIPNAVISMGCPPIDSLSENERNRYLKALHMLGQGPKTVAFCNTTKLDEKDFSLLDESNTFATFWSRKAHDDGFDREGELNRIEIPDNRRQEIWTEF